MIEPSQRVQVALDALGLDIRVQVFDVLTATAQEAADAIGCELGAIVKSLCFLVADVPRASGSPPWGQRQASLSAASGQTPARL